MAAEKEVTHGPLKLAFDLSTGNLLQIMFRDEIIAQTPTGVLPMSFAVGPVDRIQWAEDLNLRPQLVKFDEPAPGTVELTVRLGQFELVERYQLYANQARLDRSAILTNRASDAVKLRNFLVRTAGIRAGGNGFYRYPQTWPPTQHDFSSMVAGRVQPRGGSVAEASGSIAPLVAQLSPKRTILWLTCSNDDPAIALTEGNGQFEVRQEIQAMGYLRPHQPQEIGFASLLIVEADYWSSLAAYQDWLKEIGVKVPPDRAAWVPGAVTYAFHPGGTIGSNWRDLGGFKPARDLLMPTLKPLGITTAYILPVEMKSPYNPADYYHIMDGLGTDTEYAALVDRAHQMGLHVLQDLVPHGGTPSSLHNQLHPEFMLRREDGTTLNYWTNDFARPDWQAYIAKVAAYYVEKYNIDGYRVDAADGSKEENWDPNIPYARASLARLWGGLGMLRSSRAAVKKLKPRDGAILAEVSSTRYWPFCDLMYDFTFLRLLCLEWRREEPAQYAARLQEFFAEQAMVEPPGAVWLREIESHDTLRAQLWWGVEGMRTMYALSAWINGVPLIYQGMERGHSFVLSRINDLRRSRPELSSGLAHYRDVHCDTPGVFTCLRTSAQSQSVVVINFNHHPVRAKVAWPDGSASVQLRPLGYTVIPENKNARSALDCGGSTPLLPSSSASFQGGSSAHFERIPGGLAFPEATEWFVDTVEGRLQDRFIPLRPNLPPLETTSGIYWRPQNTAVIWQNDLPPLHPAYGCVGVKHGDAGWTLIRFQSVAPKDLRLLEWHAGKTGLFLIGLGAATYGASHGPSRPPAPDVTEGAPFGKISLRVVGPDYIVSNSHFAIILRRQGGSIRELRAGDQTLARDHDLYGDGEYMRVSRHPIQAMNDVECGLAFSPAPDGLRLVFEGQLRGSNRFATKRPPVWYRNEYVFTGEDRFSQKWAFRSDGPIQNRNALLTWSVLLPGMDGFRFLRQGHVLVEKSFADSGTSIAKSDAGSAPDMVAFSRQGSIWLALDQIQLAAGSKAIVRGHELRFALMDSESASLAADLWYESKVVWSLGKELPSTFREQELYTPAAHPEM
jgi:hypothetical protein